MKPFSKISYEEALVEEASRELNEYLLKEKQKRISKEKDKQ